ncbi:hypothetical protein B484DRAFT_397219, partial [Ochromonadaceae sp. CCMP2298]
MGGMIMGGMGMGGMGEEEEGEGEGEGEGDRSSLSSGSNAVSSVALWRNSGGTDKRSSYAQSSTQSTTALPLPLPLPLTMSVQEKIANVNAVLRKLSQDEDLQDDLKMAAVKTALDHWTGRRRLAPETAEKLQNNRRVVYVLQRLQMLQHVCREAGMPVPLDLMLSGAAELDSP